MSVHISIYSFTVAFVDFVESDYRITEPGQVEVGITVTGNLSFPVVVMVNVNFTTASGMTFPNNDLLHY